MNRFVLLLSPLLLVACNSTSPPIEQSFAHLQVVEAELTSKKWHPLTRFPPRYPIEEARAGKEGCATVEYVITADYEIKNVKVTGSTSKYFAKQAKLNVTKWKWADLPKGIIEEPVKTHTRFEYCLEQGDGHCSATGFAAKSQCRGEDVVASIGYKIKR
ncbi:energy transducer TonB [Thalassotalea sp. ND16A]|uniref:energy transducer TonB n=1 Tax=Thalassotalea sp. ND16A TaxID=1535422 RepID=UPI00051A4658|nr:energy transducer TonB [Thalassotalea sp. ND16A]KGK00345.1 hypothetical protein ND16A_3552 [Thalassotalea sp. ND16A]